jgi:short subunit dehydrogenase-like uncharacterized protein
MKSVLVYGATGFTGRLVVDALRKSGGLEIVLGGRDEGALRELAGSAGGLEFRVADARDAEALARATAGMHVVVDTVGPFIELGEPVLRAALEAGAHFIDTSGEQAYLLRMLQRYDDQASTKRLAVLNAHAFEYALGYCAGAIAAETPGAEELGLYYRTRVAGLSRGTQKSVLGVISRQGFEYRAGALAPLSRFSRVQRIQLPELPRPLAAFPIPGGEALHLPRSRPGLRAVTTQLLSSPRGTLPLIAGWAAGPALAWLERAGALGPVLRRIERGPVGPSDEQRQAQRFSIYAVARVGSASHTVVVSGTDAYGCTAHIVALGTKLLCEGEPLAVGVISTDRAFGARAFLRLLEPYGVALSTPA